MRGKRWPGAANAGRQESADATGGVTYARELSKDRVSPAQERQKPATHLLHLDSRRWVALHVVESAKQTTVVCDWSRALVAPRTIDRRYLEDLALCGRWRSPIWMDIASRANLLVALRCCEAVPLAEPMTFDLNFFREARAA